MKDYYVILTGGKNNAGDHLIKERAKKLLHWQRPDRNVVDYDGWVTLSDDQLKMVNGAKAIILTGGPALQKKMYPRVYGLRNQLDEIETPILTMGVGWYSPKGNWDSTHHYPLSDKSLMLLDRVNESGFLSSVRDYHTLNVLQSNGYKNFLMTGCPALYDQASMDKQVNDLSQVKKIAFSLGVTFKNSTGMYKQSQTILLMLQKLYPDAIIYVVFHHSPSSSYLDSHGANTRLYKINNMFLTWLNSNGFSYIDISGGVEKLVGFYSQVDFHIGYRIHAHIFMSSISKVSLLLNEDGRGKALRDVVGGVMFDAYTKTRINLVTKLVNKLFPLFDTHVPSTGLIVDIENALIYEKTHGVRFEQPRIEINQHFQVMNRFLKQLP